DFPGTPAAVVAPALGGAHRRLRVRPIPTARAHCAFHQSGTAAPGGAPPSRHSQTCARDAVHAAVGGTDRVTGNAGDAGGATSRTGHDHRRGRCVLVDGGNRHRTGPSAGSEGVRARVRGDPAGPFQRGVGFVLLHSVRGHLTHTRPP